MAKQTKQELKDSIRGLSKKEKKDAKKAYKSNKKAK